MALGPPVCVSKLQSCVLELLEAQFQSGLCHLLAI